MVVLAAAVFTEVEDFETAADLMGEEDLTGECVRVPAAQVPASR